MTHRPRKRFGQNFLHDPVIIGKIVSAVNPDRTDTLFEIGPGQGAITVPMLATAGTLSVVELDRDLIEPLPPLPTISSPSSATPQPATCLPPVSSPYRLRSVFVEETVDPPEPSLGGNI